jgi:hypothetical protein
MSRVKRGVTKKARHKKILKMAKGYRGRAKNCFRVAIEKVEKAMQYAYRDRKVRKRDMRSSKKNKKLFFRSNNKRSHSQKIKIRKRSRAKVWLIVVQLNTMAKNLTGLRSIENHFIAL